MVVVVVQTVELCARLARSHRMVQPIRGIRTSPRRLRHRTPALMTEAPGPVPVYRAPKTRKAKSVSASESMYPLSNQAYGKNMETVREVISQTSQIFCASQATRTRQTAGSGVHLREENP